LTTLVDRFTAPLALKELVNTGVHWDTGTRRLVPSTNVYGPLAAPLVALKVSVLPLMLMLVKRGGWDGPATTTRLSVLPLIESDAVVLAARPSPVTVTEDGAVPTIEPPVPLLMSAYVPIAKGAPPVLLTVTAVEADRVKVPLVTVIDGVPDA